MSSNRCPAVRLAVYGKRRRARRPGPIFAGADTGPNAGGEMTTADEPRRTRLLGELSERELAADGATPLPDREVMSTIRLGHGVSHLAMPINEALALNNESTDSVAFADAEQTVVMGPLDAQEDLSSTEV